MWRCRMPESRCFGVLFVTGQSACLYAMKPLDSIHIKSNHAYMRERISLTMDPRVTLRAKQLAKARGTSLSRMVENYLKKETGTERADANRKGPSFSQRWKGSGTLRSGDDPRLKRLLEKYG